MNLFVILTSPTARTWATRTATLQDLSYLARTGSRLLAAGAKGTILISPCTGRPLP
jgi:hypothetical protein